MTGLLLALVLAASAVGAPADGPGPLRRRLPPNRPPDPRCGETLDGRPLPDPSPGLAVPRAALAVPRLVTRAVLWPVVETTDVVEHYRLLDWMDALLTTDDGLVGVRPIVNYSTSFLPSGGARLFYRRLPGPGAEIAAQFETAGPEVMLGRLDLRSSRRLGLVLSATWNRRDDRLFAGIGPEQRRRSGRGGGGARPLSVGQPRRRAALVAAAPLPAHRLRSRRSAAARLCRHVRAGRSVGG